MMFGKNNTVRLRMLVGGIALLLVTGIGIGQTQPTAAVGEGTLTSMIPANAWGAIVINDLAKTSKIIDDYAQRMKLSPPGLQQELDKLIGTGSQFQADKPIAIVVMNVMQHKDSPLVVIASVKEYEKFAAAFNAKATETPGLMEGQSPGNGPVYFTQKGSYVIMAPSEPVVRETMQSSRGLSALMDADLQRLGNTSDVYIHVNLQTLGQIAKPYLGMVGAMMQMGSMGGMSGFGGEMGEAMTPQMQAQMQMAGTAINALIGLIDEMNALSFGINLNPEMIYTTGLLGFRSGQEMAKVLEAQKPTSQSLLKGLPGDGFVVAAGYEWKPVMTRFQETMLQLTPPMADPADTEKYRQISRELSQMTTAASAKFDIRQAKLGEPLIGFHQVIETTDAKKHIDLQRQMMELQSKTSIPAGEGQQVQMEMNYTPAVRKIGDVQIDQITFNLGQLLELPGLSQFPGMPGGDAQQMQGLMMMVLGNPSGMVTMNVAAVTDYLVILDFGSSPETLEKLIKTVQDGKAPLGTDPKIAKVSKLLPKERLVELYLDPSRLIGMAMGIMMPGAMEAKSSSKELIGMTGTVQGSALRMDLAVPFEVVSYIANLKNAMTGFVPGGDVPQSEFDPAMFESGETPDFFEID